MRYIETYSTDPYFNLAAEEYIFERMDRSHAYLLLWQNDNAIVVGKYQNTIQEINSSFVRDHGIRVVRRLSGGGAVYHDLGNLNFSFITDAQSADEINFKAFCMPVIQTLHSLGITAELNGRNDIAINGQKISGNAQYIKNGRRLSHGTLLFHADLNIVSQSLRVNADKIRSKGVASVSSRVTNIYPHLPTKLTLFEFKEIFLRHISCGEHLTPYSFTPDDVQSICALRDEKYRTWEWNYGRSPQYQIQKQRYFEGCGTVELSMSVAQGGAITGLSFFGDYFSVSDPTVLARALVGIPCRFEAVLARLSMFDVGSYFLSLSAERLAALITS